jgi:Na+/proline symporter
VSVEAAVVLTGVVTVVYTYLGGMKAVIWTDLVQFVIKVAGAALAGVFVLRLLPGGWGQLVELGDAADKFVLLDPAHATDPKHPFNLWAGVVGGAVFSMASHGADQLMVQRYLCARSLGQARLALVLSGFTVTAQFLLFLLVGVGLYALVQTGGFPLPARPDGRDWRPDEVFGLFIVTRLPTGVAGVLVAAVLAAAMSTLSSSLNSSANALVTDFYRPLRPGRTEAHYVRVSRFATAGWGVAQMAVAVGAYWFGGSESVVNQVLKIAGLTTGLLLGLFLLGSLPRPVSSAAALGGLAAGFLAVLAVWVPEVTGRPILAWPWFALVGTSVTVAVALALSRLLPADGPPDRQPATPGHRSP